MCIFDSSNAKPETPLIDFPYLSRFRMRVIGRFTASALRKLLSVYVFSYFPFGFEGRMLDLIWSVPDLCLSFYVIVGSFRLNVQQ